MGTSKYGLLYGNCVPFELLLIFHFPGFATPTVSGVVSLMLEATPSLGWRDVQGILASTAQMTDPENESWVTNAAGIPHS